MKAKPKKNLTLHRLLSLEQCALIFDGDNEINLTLNKPNLLKMLIYQGFGYSTGILGVLYSGDMYRNFTAV